MGGERDEWRPRVGVGVMVALPVDNRNDIKDEFPFDPQKGNLQAERGELSEIEEDEGMVGRRLYCAVRM